MQSLPAFQQCSPFPRHFIRIALFKVSCGLERMSIQTLVKTVLIVAAIMPCLSVSSAANSTVVRDTDGEALKAGSPYYVLPVIRGFGGGLTLRRRSNLCPFYVAQERKELANGIPVTFTPVLGDQTEILEDVDLQVKSAALNICLQRNTWRIDSSVDPERALVATGGTPSTFRIQPSGDFYMLVFCEEPCPSCRPVCSKLGIHIDSHFDRWLASPRDADIPRFHSFLFKKAPLADSDSDSDSGSGFQSE